MRSEFALFVLGICSVVAGPVEAEMVIQSVILDQGLGGGEVFIGANETPESFLDQLPAESLSGYFQELNKMDRALEGSFFMGEPLSGIQARVHERYYEDFEDGPADRIASLGPFSAFEATTLEFEKSISAGGDGTNQDQVTSAAWGFDTDASLSGSQTVLLFDFTDSIRDVGYFGLDVLDLESGSGSLGYVAAYDVNGNLRTSVSALSEPPSFGSNSAVFYGVSGTPDSPIGYVAIYVGGNADQDWRRNQVAAADFFVGSFDGEEGNRLTGDFDGDGELDVDDIDLLTSNIRDAVQDVRFDLNFDGVLSNDDREIWVNELKKTYFGDANLDGEFNSSDFIAVFSAGQFEDEIESNSTWESGDWNGDGDFGTGDFVAAFAAGGFELGPRQVIRTVPEPTATSLFAIGLLLVMRLAHRRSLFSHSTLSPDCRSALIATC